MSKVIKQMEMDDLRQTFKDVRNMVVMSIEKLDCQVDYHLRKTLRDKKIRLKVVKNSLTRKVFKEMNISVPDDSDFWKRPTTVAWGTGSIAQISRDIEAELKNPKNALKYKEKVTIKGAIAEGQTVPFDVAKTLPTREEVIGQIIGMILGPGSAIAGCLTGPAASVASQIEKIGEKKEEGAPAA
jgi:ribosomal protein L10